MATDIRHEASFCLEGCCLGKVSSSMLVTDVLYQRKKATNNQ
jgi:hypothetical protein